MNRLPRPAGLTISLLFLAFALLCSAGCSRPAGLQGNAVAAGSSSSGLNAGSRAGNFATTETRFAKKDSDPSRNSENLPAGTLLTVRLSETLSAEDAGSKNSESAESFEAFVDEPVVVEGVSLVAKGTAVAGRVESAQASSIRIGRGYVRMALESIRISGAEVRLQTSSLFVRGVAGVSHLSSQQASAGPSSLHQVTDSQTADGVVRVEKGRRLTFRLSEPANLTASPVSASPVSASPRAQVDQ